MVTWCPALRRGASSSVAIASSLVTSTTRAFGSRLTGGSSDPLSTAPGATLGESSRLDIDHQLGPANSAAIVAQDEPQVHRPLALGRGPIVGDVSAAHLVFGVAGSIVDVVTGGCEPRDAQGLAVRNDLAGR